MIMEVIMKTVFKQTLLFLLALALLLIPTAALAKTEMTDKELETYLNRLLANKDAIPGEIIVYFDTGTDAETMYGVLYATCARFYPDKTKEEIESIITFEAEYTSQLLSVQPEDELEILIYLNKLEETAEAVPNVTVYPDKEYIPGDVNGNGGIDSQDYAMAKRAFLKTYTLTDEQFARADINGNGKLDSSEYAMIKRHFLGTYVIPAKAE